MRTEARDLPVIRRRRRRREISPASRRAIPGDIAGLALSRRIESRIARLTATEIDAVHCAARIFRKAMSEKRATLPVLQFGAARSVSEERRWLLAKPKGSVMRSRLSWVKAWARRSRSARSRA